MFASAFSTSRTNLRVLIVDDDPLLGEVLGMHVDSLGCTPTVVETAEDALEVLREEQVHLLVTDWQMPGMDGMALVHAARQATSADHHLHIAMMTARGEEKVIRAAMDAGVDDFLFKPIQLVELELVIKSAARNRLLHHRLMRRNALLQAAQRRTRDALEAVRADLSAATALHERLMPNIDRIGALGLAHIYRPATILGGDSIGVAALREEGLLFFLIDVSGHGVPAALDSFHLHHRIKGMRPTSPEELARAVANLNREICERTDDGYATIGCGLIFPDKREGWLISAGHPAPFLVIDGKAKTIDGGRAMPVGWFESAAYEPTRFDFPEGARLVVYSDGLTDALVPDTARDPVDSVGRLLAANAHIPLTGLTASLESSLSERRSPLGFPDDISVLMIEHTASEAMD